MCGIKKYFKEETKWSLFWLHHPNPSDFYLSVWQSNRSALPLVIGRSLLFLLSLAIVLTSMIFYIVHASFHFWFIYLTHWGLILITVTTAFSSLLSVRCYFYGPISNEFKLPWYVKVYWVLYNISAPLSFLITIFYWAFLFEAGVEEEMHSGLDVAVHGLNSLVMLLLLTTSRQPSRLLHIYQPVTFGVAYILFSVVYHFAGGVNRKGEAYIYSVIDWNNPGVAIGVVIATGVLFAGLHLFIIMLAQLRDFTSSRLIHPRVVINNVPEHLPLHRTDQRIDNLCES